jgi:hypothetical protein
MSRPMLAQAVGQTSLDRLTNFLYLCADRVERIAAEKNLRAPVRAVPAPTVVERPDSVAWRIAVAVSSVLGLLG